MLSRRRFLVWVSSAVPLAVVSRRADALAAAWISDDTETIRALAEAVLPSELGREGAASAARDFQRWIDGYRENAELVHGYGTSALQFAPASPRARWAAQLADLRDLPRIGIDARRAKVRDALREIPGDRMPDVGAAPHVAIALMSHYFQSSDAADLAYRARIGRAHCRPLASASRKPLPLADGA